MSYLARARLKFLGRHIEEETAGGEQAAAPIRPTTTILPPWMATSQIAPR
jgi:hypothetical protein